MKKFIFTLLALMALVPAFADNYIIFGDNDTLRIHPTSLGFIERVMVRAHFDCRLDHWDIRFDYPSWMHVRNIYKRNDMLYVPYLDSDGNSTSCNAPLYWNKVGQFSSEDSLSCSITDAGYWDPNNTGNYVSYGTVKWEAGNYNQMFEIYFDIADADTIMYGNINFRCWLSSTSDMRGGTITDTSFIRNIYVYVGYMRGDVNGDGHVGIEDITAFADYILNNISFDIYQEKAADINGDGIIDIADFTALTDLLLGAGQMSLEDLETL